MDHVDRDVQWDREDKGREEKRRRGNTRNVKERVNPVSPAGGELDALPAALVVGPEEEFRLPDLAVRDAAKDGSEGACWSDGRALILKMVGGPTRPAIWVPVWIPGIVLALGRDGVGLAFEVFANLALVDVAFGFAGREHAFALGTPVG